MTGRYAERYNDRYSERYLARDTGDYGLSAISTLAITGTVAATADVGLAYADTSLAATGGDTASISWSATGLPPGVVIDNATGALSGTPTTAGSYTPSIQLEDLRGVFAYSAQAITVAAQLALSGTLPGGTHGVAYSQSYTRTGGTGTYTYSISAGALPASVTINSSTGVISGTTANTGDFTFTVRVVDTLGQVATRAATVTWA